MNQQQEKLPRDILRVSLFPIPMPRFPCNGAIQLSYSSVSQSPCKMDIMGSNICTIIEKIVHDLQKNIWADASWLTGHTITVVYFQYEETLHCGISLTALLY